MLIYMLRSVCLGQWRHITVRLFFDAASQTTFFIPFQWQKSIFLVKFAYGWKSIFSNCNVHFRPFSRNERQRKKNSFCLYIYICGRASSKQYAYVAYADELISWRHASQFMIVEIWLLFYVFIFHSNVLTSEFLSLSQCLPLFLPCQCS